MNPSAIEETPIAKAAARYGGARTIARTVISKCGILFFNAATGIISARMLKPEGRGELAAMILWPLFLAYVTSLGIPSSLIYTLKTREEDQPGQIVNGMIMSLLFGVLATIGGALVLPSWLGHQYSPTIVLYAQLFLLATPLLALVQTGRAIMEATGHFNHSNQLQLLYPGTALLGLVLLAALHHLTPISAAASYIGATVPNFVLMVYRLWRLVYSKWRVRLSTCRMLLGYGVRSYGIDLLGTLALQVDQVLVIRLLSSSQMGAYGVVLSLSRMFNLVQGSIVMVLFPKASGRPAQEVLSLVERCARIGTLVTLCCSLVVSLVGSRVLSMLYGREYANNGRTLEVLLLEVTLSGCVFILAQAFMALGRPGIVSILQAIGLGLSIPLMLVLVPRYGVMGAAVSLLISTVARFIFVYMGFRMFLKAPLPRLIPQIDDLNLLRSMLPPRISKRAAHAFNLPI